YRVPETYWVRSRPRLWPDRNAAGGQRMSAETQKTIYDWAIATFGQPAEGSRGRYAVIERTIGEMREFAALSADGSLEPTPAEIADEAADVVIMLYQVCQLYGVDLATAVEMKMEKNRRRKWKVNGLGVGQHIREG